MARLIKEIPTVQTNLSIENGLGAYALFFRGLNLYRPHKNVARLAQACLNQTLWLPSPPGGSIYQGYTGTLWLQRLLGMRNPRRREEPAQRADLRRWLAAEKECDLIRGLTGLGVALLADPRAAALEPALVRRLLDLIHVDENGDSFWPIVERKGERVPPGARKVADLGLAHGLPGTITYFAYLQKRRPGLLSTAQKKRVGDVVDFLLKLDAGRSRDGFGYFSDDPPGVKVRSAWCYGDPGVGFSLIQAGTAFQKIHWLEAGLRIARRGLARGFRASQIISAYPCHGSIGLAHLSARLYQQTGDGFFAEQAERWYDRSVPLYRDRDPAAYGAPGLLWHPLGYFHCAVAACLPESPDWDSMLLMSPPGWKSS